MQVPAKTIILSLILALAAQACAQPVKVMTFNIRYASPDDGKNIWDNRKSELLETVRYYHPDFLGLQEALLHQLQYVDDGLPQHTYIGVGRDDGKEKGEFSPILYNAAKFKLVTYHTFWLSDTPDTVSVGWDAAMERICTYGLFKEKKTGRSFHVFNTHFDHVGKEARMMSARLILKKMEELTKPKDAVVLMGDFNSEPENEPIKIVKEKLTDGADAASGGIYGPTGTYNAFDNSRILENRIDYIFVKNLKVLRYRHIDDRMKNNNLISDHIPVMAEVSR